MGRRVRKVGVGGWSRGVGSGELRVGRVGIGELAVRRLRSGELKLGGLGGRVERVEVGGVGSGVLGLVKLGSGRLESGGWRRRGWGRGS